MSMPRSFSLKPEVALANTLALSLPSENMAMIDLHGLSVSEAKHEVTTHIRRAASENWGSMRIVTGRGNHINAKGERGTLYKNFKDWLQDVKSNITQVNQHDGYYEIDINKGKSTRIHSKALFSDEDQTTLSDNIDLLIAAAANGEFDAVIALAICYEEGIGVKQDSKKATNCFLQIKDKGHAIVEYELGCRYYIGIGIKQNDHEALRYLTLAADKRYVKAAYILGMIHWRGTISKPDYALGHNYLLIAAEEGDPESARRVGCSFHDGLGCAVNQKLATEWWQKGAERGDCTAAFNLVSVYEKNNPKLALKYLKMSAELGDPDGQFFYGMRMFFGIHGLPSNPKEGLIWINMAAEKSSTAQYFLAQFWVKRDNGQAKKYLIMAADNGDIEAQFFIVMRSVETLNTLLRPTLDAQLAAFVPFDQTYKDKILKSFLSHSEDYIFKIKNKDIQTNMIDLLVCQDSTKKQNQVGVKVLRKLIAVKDMDALVRLACLYMTNGLPGIKKNPQEAFNLWSQGAKTGHSQCYRHLGNYWQVGLGGKIDLEKALNAYHSAAINGCSNTAMLLSKHYFEKDELDKFHNYLSLAANLGDEQAKTGLVKLSQNKLLAPLFSQQTVKMPFFANRHPKSAKNDEKKSTKKMTVSKHKNKK